MYVRPRCGLIILFCRDGETGALFCGMVGQDLLCQTDLPGRDVADAEIQTAPDDLGFVDGPDRKRDVSGFQRFRD